MNNNLLSNFKNKSLAHMMTLSLRKVLFSIFSILLLIPISYGQAPELNQDDIYLTGTLVEQETEEPLPYATIAIHSPRDSSVVNSALTVDNGEFEVAVPSGSYYAVIHYIGFQDKVVRDLVVPAQRDTLEMGTIEMVSDAISLQQIEVRAEKSQMEFKLDRRVFNVGKDLTNSGNSAADILDNVPSVTVDPEGNVSLRGSQGVRILVDGKPSGLLSAGETEALLRMQGSIIESVEVITNPSARYEAEGEAGIINIILKKDQEKGINGSFGVTMGHPANYGASYNLNFRRSDLNFFSNFGLDYRKSPGGGSSTRQFFEDGMLTRLYTTETEQTRGGFGGFLQLGTDWNINENNILTASLLYRAGKDNNDATIVYRDLDENEDLINETVREVMEGEDEHNLEASLNYKKTYDNPDHQWNTVVQYILDDDTELADYLQTETQQINPLIQKSSNTEDESNFLFQSDYIYPFGENSKVEAGMRAAIRTVQNEYRVEEDEEGDFVTLPEFDDQLKYNENIYAAYFIGAHELGDFSVQLGLRGELSDITAALLKSDVSNEQNYFNLFPSASVSYSISEKDQFQVSYSRRLSRPYFRRLLPFSNFNDPRNNNIGNPNLRPEFTNSYEAGYLHYFETGSILSSVYYRQTSGVIEELTLPSEDGTTIEYPVNLSSRNSYGLEFNFNYDLTKWWDVNANANFYRSLTDGEYEGIQYDNDTYTWSSQTNTTLDIGDLIKVQMSFDYIAPRNTTQGRRLARYNFDLAASLDVFDNKGTFTLTGSDIFNTRRRRSIIDQPTYYEESDFQWRQRRRITLSFNYRLNE